MNFQGIGQIIPIYGVLTISDHNPAGGAPRLWRTYIPFPDVERAWLERHRRIFTRTDAQDSLCNANIDDQSLCQLARASAVWLMDSTGLPHVSVDLRTGRTQCLEADKTLKKAVLEAGFWLPQNWNESENIELKRSLIRYKAICDRVESRKVVFDTAVGEVRFLNRERNGLSDWVTLFVDGSNEYSYITCISQGQGKAMNGIAVIESSSKIFSDTLDVLLDFAISNEISVAKEI